MKPELLEILLKYVPAALAAVLELIRRWAVWKANQIEKRDSSAKLPEPSTLQKSDSSESQESRSPQRKATKRSKPTKSPTKRPAKSKK